MFSGQTTERNCAKLPNETAPNYRMNSFLMMFDKMLKQRYRTEMPQFGFFSL